MVVKKIKEVGKVIEALTDLLLKVGTMIAVLKLILDSRRGGNSPTNKITHDHRKINERIN